MTCFARSVAKCSGAKRGIGVELDRLAGRDRVADAKEPGIDQADHVAGIGALDRLALAREEAVRPGHAHLAAQPRVVDGHVLLEDARADAHERDAVAVALVHVRLDLEDEAGEDRRSSVRARCSSPPSCAWRGAGGGASSSKRVEERLDAEVVQRAAEEDRDHARRAELLRGRTRAPAPSSSSTSSRSSCHAVRADRVVERRIVETADRRPARPTRRAAVRSKRSTCCCAGRRRPGTSGRLPIGQFIGTAPMLQLAARSRSSSSNGSRAGLVELVDEGEDRDVPHAADLEQLARLRLDALRRVEHHHRAVGRGERAVGVFAEVLVAGRVEQVEAVAVVLELQRGRGDRDAALCSIAIQSEVACRCALRARTAPAISIAPP